MQPNDFSRPTDNAGGFSAQPGVQPQPQFSQYGQPVPPAPVPVTPGGPLQAPYSPELAAQLTGRPVAPAQSGIQPQPQPQQYGAPQQPYPTNPYAPGQPGIPAPTTPAQYYAAQQAAAAQPSRPRTRLVALLAVPVLVLLVALGGFAYLQSKHGKTAASTSANSSAKKAVAASGATGDLASLKSFSLAAPADSQLTGLTSKGVDATTHLTSYVNSDQSCTLGFGMSPAGVGTAGDVGTVAAAALAAVKKADPNVQITGPNKIAALKLKADDGKTYALPTVNYAFTDTTAGGGTIVETYGTYQLADGGHAVAFAFCKSDTPNQQSALSSKVNALQPTLEKITVTTK